MRILFVHPNFGSQFLPLAWHLAADRGWECTVASAMDVAHLKLPFNHVAYPVRAGPLPREPLPIVSVKDKLDHMLGAYRALKEVKGLKPDLVVGHTSFGTSLYLRTLFDCPFVGYFEWLSGRFWTDDLVYRPDYPPGESVRLGMATYHALTYAQLHQVDAAYAPTEFQRSRAPAELQGRIRTQFDGIDTKLFAPREIVRPVVYRGVRIEPGTRVVTYCSPGLESMRGFDIFMQVARAVCAGRDDVIFLVAGEERTVYGHELEHIRPKSFKQHVLDQGPWPLDRIHFLGRVPFEELPRLFNLSDLHVYLTVPYTVSWSLIQAMASGCAVLGSDTEPVREVVDDGVQGRLAPFFDAPGLGRIALELLADDAARARLGQAARARAQERYAQSLCFDRLAAMFEEVGGSS